MGVIDGGLSSLGRNVDHYQNVALVTTHVLVLAINVLEVKIINGCRRFPTLANHSNCGEGSQGPKGHEFPFPCPRKTPGKGEHDCHSSDRDQNGVVPWR